ncbi:hypothetical protein [Rhodococcus sp. HNM0569]|uniref:hypothetical protein n=1 Tax=Rhodococcus sp. HNM0569 TaxID=2716340 RepID=UPI00146B7C9F|nr:hypothetical protein [Rhodococcus sp. HNM0569]NLU82724.1 hypothetical protein [Rhodococcus sp. HNM0569]
MTSPVDDAATTWDAWVTPYLVLGFVPRSEATVTSTISGTTLDASPGPSGLVVVTASRIDVADDHAVCDSGWDAEHVANSVWQLLERIGTPEIASSWPVGRLDQKRAAQITTDAMLDSRYRRFTVEALPMVPHLSYSLDETLARRASFLAAREGFDAGLLGWIALEHPDHDVRRAAAMNLACPDAALVELTRAESTAGWLLQRAHLSTDVMRALVEVEALRYVSSPCPEAFRRRLLDLALHDACPPERVQGLIAHATLGDTRMSVLAAERAWNAPHVKRDEIHLQLLAHVGRVSIASAQLLDAVTQGDAARIAWLRGQNERYGRLLDG